MERARQEHGICTDAGTQIDLPAQTGKQSETQCLVVNALNIKMLHLWSKFSHDILSISEIWSKAGELNVGVLKCQC